MANDNGTVSIRISINAYASLKRLADEKGYTYGGFAERAIMDRVEKERKSNKRKLNKK